LGLLFRKFIDLRLSIPYSGEGTGRRIRNQTDPLQSGGRACQHGSLSGKQSGIWNCFKDQDLRLPANDIEKELFRQISEGNEMAFREVFYRFGKVIHPFVLGIVKRDEVAREIIQEVFLRVWLNRHKLPGIENPASWIYRIAGNLSLTYFRRQQIEARVMRNVQEQIAEPGNSSSDILQGKELQGLINQAVTNLPPLRRKIFILCRERGLTRREVALELNISENTVRNQLAIALKSIQTYIKKEGNPYFPLLILLPALTF
jgi:RNA polymerase sigma-70 factor (ECF subfamily)